MVVRIRFGRGPRIGRKRRPTFDAASAAAALLTPAALMALVLGLWRIAADLEWASDFAIPQGFFSHWQVWVAAAVILQVCSRLLSRLGKSSEAELAGELGVTGPDSAASRRT